ncbi:MAG: DNA replication complex GINS family protein [Desulfurococcaceae archaeon]|nr:DNA replication complex GINS family protein [Desulfurococcales archaeon]MCI4456578.1 DNA replication complex GINS family protein [Desulfurococcaceae archaeon]
MFMKAFIESIKSLDMHSPVRVMVLKDIGKTGFTDIDLVRGVEIDLPRWVAETLENKEYVKIIRNVKSSDDVNRIRFQEERRSEGSKYELHKIPPNLYYEIRRLIREYEKKIDSKDPRVFQEIEKLKKSFEKILSLRYKKILYYIQVSENIDEELEKRMTLEEKIFYRLFLRNIHKWINSIAVEEGS